MRFHLPALNHGVMDPAPALYVVRINGYLGATVLSAFPAMASCERLRDDDDRRTCWGKGASSVTKDSSRDAWLQQARSYLRDADPVLARLIDGKWRPYRSLATSYLFSAAFEPAEAPPGRPAQERLT